MARYQPAWKAQSGNNSALIPNVTHQGVAARIFRSARLFSNVKSFSLSQRRMAANNASGAISQRPTRSHFLSLVPVTTESTRIKFYVSRQSPGIPLASLVF
jgi:hypothetical protein